MRATACLSLRIALVSLFSVVPAKADYPIGARETPAVVVHSDPAQFSVYPRHPRLFFRNTDVPVLRQRIAGEYRDLWTAMTAILEQRQLKQDPAKYTVNPYLKSWTYGRNMAFAAALTGEACYRDWALRWADLLADADPKQDKSDDDFRGRLMSLAVAYDWLYPDLSEARREQYRRAIAVHIERNWYFAERPNFVSGHSRWGNFSLAAGLLAIVTEMPEMQPKLRRVRDNWLFGYHPAQGWIAQDGGHHMAWSYSVPYTDARNHCVWSSATNECVYYPWRGQWPYLYLYGNRGDGTFANVGDAYAWTMSGESDSLVVAAGVLKNRHAAAMLPRSWDSFYEILYGDASVRALAPDDLEQPLPLARCFRPSGIVVMRDRWDDRTTHLLFKSSGFYSANHHHRDENGFTLSYRGDLAIDSGHYDLYGNSHWRNYLTRTIAHNAITVFDPDQEYRASGKEAANDGGQVFREEPAELKDIRPGGHAALGGIQRFEHRDAFTYALGSATRAYDPQRVRLAEREIVFLRSGDRPHPLIVVFDRVESARPEFRKRFLLHTTDKPSLDGHCCVALSPHGGRLTSFTLLPQEAELHLVGGSGLEFSINGQNYPPESLSKAWKSIAGAWRVEVEPRTSQCLDHFLHVMLVDDVEARPVDPESVVPISGDGCAGVEVAGWTIVFPTERRAEPSWSYRFSGKPGRHLVVGCPIQKDLQCTPQKGPACVAHSGDGGCAVFEVPGEQGHSLAVGLKR